MNKRKWLTVATILIFLFPLLDGLLSLSIFLRETAYAESNVSTIIERDEIKVTYSYEEDSVDDTYVNWKINYQHDVTSLDSRVLSAAIKFRLVTPLTENQYLDFTGSTFMDNQDGWYRQSEFTPTSEGSFLLRSPKDVPVSLIFQMDTINLVDRVVEKEVTVEVEKEVEIPQEEIQTAIDEANTAIAEAEETGDEDQVAVAQAMAADIPTTRMEMVSETQIEEEIIQAEELAENVLDSGTAKEYTLDFANYAEPEIVESTEISEASTVDSSSFETLETQTSSITEEQTSSSEAETLKTTETSVEETGNSSQEDAVASKDDDESQEQAAVAVPFSAARRLRSASVDEDNPFDIKTEKRARLATVDGEGNTLTAKEAWDARLYEIELDVSSIALPGSLSGDIVIYFDASSSLNGGTRETAVRNEITSFVRSLENEEGIRIAIVPIMANPETKGNNVHYSTIAELLDTQSDGDTLLKNIMDDYLSNTGNAAADEAVNYAYLKKLYDNTNPISFFIGGKNFSEQISTNRSALKSDSQAIITALLDEKSDKMLEDNWADLVTQLDDESYLYFDKRSGGSDAEIIRKALDELRKLVEVENIIVQDMVTDYFNILNTSISNEDSTGTITNQVVSYEVSSMTPPTVEGGRYTWSETFLIQAKDDFIGGNCIPTNISSSSYVLESDDKYFFNKIYSDEFVDGIDTPYVNVKVFGGVVNSEETILLGEPSALAETDIKNGWATDQELLASYRNADGTFKYDVQPSIVFGNELNPLYNADTIAPTIAGSTDYTSTGELIAGTKEGGDAAASYVSSYGTVSGEGIPVTAENTAEIDGTHTLTVIDTSLTIKKLLDNDELPANFSAIFTIARIDEKPIIPPSPTNFTVNTSVSEGEFTGLGTGSYKITETLDEDLEGIKKPTELTVVITAKENTSTPSFKIMINGVEHTDETYIINNETKDLNLNILKREAGTSNPINGVYFTLTKVGETVGTDYKTEGNGNISIGPDDLVVGNSYTLVEKEPAPGFLPHETIYTITVDILGNISVTGGPAGNVKIDYNDDYTTVVDLTVFNNRKGVLPSTGGPGRQMFSVIALILMLSVAGISVIYVHRNRKGGA